MQDIKIPTELVLDLTFGGKDLSTLFVTTGSTAYNFTTGTLTDRKFSSQSGLIFKILGLNTKGYAGRKVCI